MSEGFETLSFLTHHAWSDTPLLKNHMIENLENYLNDEREGEEPEHEVEPEGEEVGGARRDERVAVCVDARRAERPAEREPGVGGVDGVACI